MAVQVGSAGTLPKAYEPPAAGPPTNWMLVGGVASRFMETVTGPELPPALVAEQV